MILTDRTITIRNSKSLINEPIVLYRGDYEVSIKFTIMESKFRFKSGANLVYSEKASYGQLAVLAPYGGNVFSDIVKCEDGTVTFTLTKEMIDQLEEVGLYSFQIRLFDYYRESRVSIPPVEFGIEVREPVASEDHDNEINNAIVGYSIAKVTNELNENVGPTFDDDGNYNKTNWETGDRISQGKLNKIEEAIDTIHRNGIDDKNFLNKQMTSNFNVLQSQIDNLVNDNIIYNVNDNIIYFNNVNELNVTSSGADITGPLQTLINNLPANKSNVVVIPSGTYKINGLNLISNLTLDISDNANIITDDESTFILKDLRNVTIKGGNFNGSGYKGIFIAHIIDCVNVKVDGIKCRRYKSGITVTNSNECRIINNTFSDLVDISGGIGISFVGSNDCFAAYNKIDNVYQDCILVYNNSKNIIITNNICSNWNKEIDQGRAGIQVYWSTDCIVSNNICYIDDNIEFDSTATEIAIRARDCDNIKIDNNYVYGTNGAGIESIILNDCPHTTFTQNNISITNNTILNVGICGITCGKGATSTVYPLKHIICNNIIENVAWRYSNGAGTGINSYARISIISNNIVSNCDDIGIAANFNAKITNNHITDIGIGIGGSVGVQKTGIFVTGTGQEILFNTIEDSKDVKTMVYAIKQYGDTSSCIVFGNNYIGGVSNRKDGTFLSPNQNV